MSETLDFGSDDTVWRRIRQRTAFAGAAVVATLLATEQPTAIHDDSYRPGGDSAMPGAVSFAFEPHHQTVLFTPMGSVLVRANHTVNPVSVSFENIHCQQRQVWGSMDVYAGNTLDRFSNIALPTNPLILDCLIDNHLSNPAAEYITIGINEYRYQVDSQRTVPVVRYTPEAYTNHNR